jgi:predicted AAA+ superfamily ATPase
MAKISGDDVNIVAPPDGEEFGCGTNLGDRFQIYEHMVTGGFPEPLQWKNHRRHQAWFESYLSTLMDRDIRSRSNIQDLTAMPRLLKLPAARVGTLHNPSEISRSSGIPNGTLTRY